MERWRNKVAVVTGASGGIGSACTKALIAEGMIVVGLARRQEHMENVLKAMLPQHQQSRFHAVRCDVRNEDDIRQAFAWIEENFVGVDVLINNAAFVKLMQIVTANNTADLRETIDTNILGVALCTREAFRSMKQRGSAGHIIMMNSSVGHSVPECPGASLNIYPSTKHALTAMTEVLRQEFLLNGTKIKITSISPGAVNTQIIGYSNLPTEFPLLRPEDVADTVVYCLQTPPNVQIHELTVRALGARF